MKDPIRLLDAQSGAEGLERELLASLPSMGPPEGAKARAWEALAVQLAAASVVGASVGTAKAAGAATKVSVFTKLVSAKTMAILVVGGLAVGGGTWALSPSQETESRGVPQNVAQTKANAPTLEKRGSVETPVAELTEPREEPEAALPNAQVGPKGLKRRDAATKASAPERQDALIRESALLKQARAQLQAGNAKAAQASLERLSTEFPEGVLGQEREVLAIAVLSAQGQVKRAQERARAFVQGHPQSPHSAKLRAWLEKP